MKTEFTDAMRADPVIRDADQILRKCVHCGFCLTACPTYAILGDERDSPRGRIYMIKDMLEAEGAAPGGRPSGRIVHHVDRCLSCLGCVSACPSGVDYQHLIDQARAHIETHFRRPLGDRLLRGLLARILPRPAWLRAALAAARLARPFAGLAGKRLAGMIRMAPAKLPRRSAIDAPQVFPAEGKRRMRVALLTGCAQKVLRPAINEATVRLLTRHGCEVVVVNSKCCGALVHHIGHEAEAMAAARANIAAWTVEVDGGGLDAVIANASGCGTQIKDYGFMLRGDADWAAAAKISSLARDLSEVVAELGLAPVGLAGLPAVAYHDACSLRHGQGIAELPRRLLAAAGFEVREIAEGHFCCGSAGTYNILQPAMAAVLLTRKVANIEATAAAAVATGNIGCLVQMAGAAGVPVVHTVELLDWASGGPKPPEL